MDGAATGDRAAAGAGELRPPLLSRTGGEGPRRGPAADLRRRAAARRPRASGSGTRPPEQGARGGEAAERWRREGWALRRGGDWEEACAQGGGDWEEAGGVSGGANRALAG